MWRLVGWRWRVRPQHYVLIILPRWQIMGRNFQENIFMKYEEEVHLWQAIVVTIMRD